MNSFIVFFAVLSVSYAASLNIDDNLKEADQYKPVSIIHTYNPFINICHCIDRLSLIQILLN